MWTVRIDEVGVKGKTYESRVRTATSDEALPRALQKIWGVGTIWQPDSGVPGLGQVFKSIHVLGDKGAHSYTSRTGKARLTIYEE